MVVGGSQRLRAMASGVQPELAILAQGAQKSVAGEYSNIDASRTSRRNELCWSAGGAIARGRLGDRLLTQCGEKVAGRIQREKRLSIVGERRLDDEWVVNRETQPLCTARDAFGGGERKEVAKGEAVPLWPKVDEDDG